MNQEHKPNTIQETSIVNKFDDESMWKRISTLSQENKDEIDNALNLVGLSIEQCKDIILSAEEDERQEIASLLGDIRMTVDHKMKIAACKEFAQYINSI